MAKTRRNGRVPKAMNNYEVGNFVGQAFDNEYDIYYGQN
jgi:hypothetical protein